MKGVKKMEYMTKYDDVGNVDGNVYTWRGETAILLQTNLDCFYFPENPQEDALLRFVELKRTN